jgi:hypothetical protein
LRCGFTKVSIEIFLSGLPDHFSIRAAKASRACPDELSETGDCTRRFSLAVRDCKTLANHAAN